MKVVVFDVDGVLLDTELGSFKEIGVMLGKEKEIRKHDEEYQKRKAFGPWGLDELALIFSGTNYNTIKKLAKKVISDRLMRGIDNTIKELKKRGYILVSYSSSPMFVMEALREKFCFDDICGNILEIKEGKLTGKLCEKVDRYVKAEKLKKFMEENNISKEDTYIVGDSVTDLPMAEYGHFIAFNSDSKEVKSRAEQIVDKKDLREILRYFK